MKKLIIASVCVGLISLLVSACAPSTDALVREAKQSGNWTLVNQRLGPEEEQMLARVSQCDDDKLMMCSTSNGQSKCSCVPDVVARERFKEITEVFR
jgi:hypothetical protein